MGRRNRERLERYLPRLYGYAMSLSGNRDDAHDLVQESALKALHAKSVPTDEAAYRAWLFRILRNTFVDGARRDNAYPSLSMEDADTAEDAAPWNHDDSLISTLTVRVCLQKLTPAQREILALVDVAGFSYGEIANFLGVPVGTVMSRISRARRALLRELDASNLRALPAGKRKRAG